jgi:hypothetical protein
MIGTNQWPTVDRMWTHGVNLGQAMNTWGAMYRLTGNKSYLAAGRAGWEKVMHYHGQASGVFTGDENLSGRQPTRGTETCAVVETMNSAAEMFLTTGRVVCRPQRAGGAKRSASSVHERHGV